MVINLLGNAIFGTLLYIVVPNHSEQRNTFEIGLVNTAEK